MLNGRTWEGADFMFGYMGSVFGGMQGITRLFLVDNVSGYVGAIFCWNEWGSREHIDKFCHTLKLQTVIGAVITNIQTGSNTS